MINYLIKHPPERYSKKTLTENLSGLTIPGKTAKNIVHQAMYMFRRVREIYQSSLKMGETGERPTGVGITYGYDKLLPLIRSQISIRQSGDASREGDTDSEPAQTLTVDGQRQKTYTPAQTPLAPTPSKVTTAPEQKEPHNGLIVAADDATRRDQLAIERGRLKVSMAKVQLKRRRLDIEERRMKMELSLEERRMQKSFELEEKKLALEERNIALEEEKFKLERRRLILSATQE